MSNIQAFAEIVWKRLGAFDQDKQYDVREILIVADGCRADFMSKMWEAKKIYPTGEFTRTYPIDILDTDDNSIKTFQLPKNLANTTQGLGIVSISNDKMPYVNWIPLDAGRLDQFDFKGLNRTVYWMEGQQINIVGYLGSKALIRMIPSLLDLDTDDEIFGNSEYENMIADMTVSKLELKRATPQINANDGTQTITAGPIS